MPSALSSWLWRCATTERTRPAGATTGCAHYLDIVLQVTGYPSGGESCASTSPAASDQISLAFDDDGAVVGAFVSVLPHLAIGGAVIPGLGLLESGKLQYDHALDRRALEYFLAAIVCAGCLACPVKEAETSCE
jgi:hypothetical protein